MSLPTTSTSPHFASSSFLVFENDDTLKSAFSECMQLSPSHSARRALKSLLTCLDQSYPGPAFFVSKANRLGKIADQWLEKPWWAGKTYWGKDHRHLEGCEENEGAELTWPEDEKTLKWGGEAVVGVVEAAC